MKNIYNVNRWIIVLSVFLLCSKFSYSQYCSGLTTLTAPSGTFDDGSGTSSYSNSSNCSWLIQPSGATAIYLEFASFYTESGYDYVKVYDGPGTGYTLLGTYSGSSVPAPLTSSTGSLYITFYTDGSVTYDGWTINYSSCQSAFTPVITAGGPTSFCGGGVTLSTNSCSNCTYQWKLNGSNISGANALSYYATQTGSYTVMVIDSTGCAGISSPMGVTNSGANVSITYSGATTFCQGSSIAMNATYNSSWTYQWRLNGINISGATNYYYTATSSGTYDVVVTVNSCTSYSNSVNVTVVPGPGTPVITAAGPTTFCQGGSVMLSTTPVSGCTYQWKLNGSNIIGANASAYIASSTGSYTIFITNSNNCSATSNSITVTNATPTISVYASPSSVCSGGTSSLSTTISPSGTYTYNWSPVSGLSNPYISNPTATVNSSSTYYVTVTNSSSGCTATGSVSLSTFTPQQATITANGSTTICQGSYVYLTANSGSYYHWSNGSTSQSISASISGTYIVTVTYAGGCTSVSNPVTVTVNQSPATPVITPSASQYLCSGDTIFLSTPYVPGLTYQWRLNGVNISGANSSTYNVTTLGNYSLQVSNSSGCYSLSSTVYIYNGTTTISINYSTPTTFCDGDSVLLSATSGTSYQWKKNGNDIAGAISSSYVAKTSGSYSVTEVNNYGCVVSSSVVTVTVKPIPAIPVVTASGPTSFCDGGSVNLSSSSLISNVWSTGQTSQNITVSTSGSYVVSVVGGNGCSSSSMPVSITNYGPFSYVSADAESGCTGQTTQLNVGGVTAFTENFDPISSSNWTSTLYGTVGAFCSSVSGNCLYFNGSSTREAITKNINTIGGGIISFYLKIAYTTTGICEKADNGENVLLQYSTNNGTTWSTIATYLAGYTTYDNFVLINVSIPAAAQTTSTKFKWCQPANSGSSCDTWALDNIAINAAALQSDYTFAWYPSTDLSDTTVNNPVATFNNPITYNVIVTDTVHGCVDTADIFISPLNSQSAIINNGEDTIFYCPGYSKTLTASTGLSYLWSTGSTLQSVSVSTSGTYTVTITYQGGCTSVASVEVVPGSTITPTPQITTGGSSVLCLGDSILLQTTSSYPGASYQWLLGGVAINGATGPTYEATVSGSYYVSVSHGCSATSPSYYVSYVSQPTYYNTTNLTCCQGDSIYLSASSASNTLWQWYKDGLPISGATNYYYYAKQSGVYYLDAQNTSYGCSWILDSLTVTVFTSPTAPVITSSGSTSFCNSSDVTLSSDITSNIVWSTGESTANIIVNQSGSYTVSYTDGYGCSSTSSPVTVSNQGPFVNVSADNTSVCSGGTVNLYSIMPSAFNEDFDPVNNSNWYAITNGIIGSSFCSSVSGNCLYYYGSNIREAITKSLNVIGGGTISFYLKIAYTTTGICEKADAGEDVLLQYSTNNGSTWNTMATYAAGTTTYDNFMLISVSIPAVAQTSATMFKWCQPVNSGSSCDTWALDDVQISSVVSSNSNYIYSWSPSTGLSDPNISNPVAIVNSDITYSLLVTDTVSGCSDTSNIVISTYSVPQAIVTPADSVYLCTGNVTTLTSSSGQSYIWSNSSTTQNITVSQPGQYDVTVTYPGGCTSVSNNVNVLSVSNPSAAITPSGIVYLCQGQNITLTADSSNGGTYQWMLNGSNISGATNQTYTVLNGGSYSVVITNGSGCSSTSVATTVNLVTLSANITSGSSTTICQGDSVMLSTGTGYGYTYQWKNNGVDIAGAVNSVYYASNQGSYSVVVSSNGCSSTSSTVTVTVNPLPNTPTITASGPTTFCQGSNVILTSSNSDYYSWSNGATTQSTTVSQTGNYVVTVTNFYGCSLISNPESVVNGTPNITVTASQNNVCSGSQVQLTVSNISNFSEDFDPVDNSNWYAITNGTIGSSFCSVVSGNSLYYYGNSIREAITNNLNVSGGGTVSFYLKISYTSTGICEMADAGENVLLQYSTNNGSTWTTMATYTAGTTTYDNFVLINESIPVAAQTSATMFKWSQPTNSSAGYDTWALDNIQITVNGSSCSSCNYSWAPSSGLSDPNISNPVATVNSDISYVVTVTEQSSGCATTGGVSISMIPAEATITASGPTTFCQGGNVILTANVGGSYLWSNGSITQSITVTQSGNYMVTVTNPSGCGGSYISMPVTVNVTTSPTATITPNGPTSTCQGDTVILTANSGTSFLWSNGATSQSIAVTQSGNFTVTVTNAGGCSGTAVSSPESVIIFQPPATPVITQNVNTLTSSSALNNQWYINGNIIYGATSQTYVITQPGTYTVEVTDNNGCSTMSGPLLIVVLDISLTTSGLNDLNIYPNPFYGETSLVYDINKQSIVSIEVFDMFGRKLKTIQEKTDQMPNRYKYNVEVEKAGVYFVVFETNDYRTIRQIVNIAGM